jgi:drug/metabolite transporter (DMT)-like permease
MQGQFRWEWAKSYWWIVLGGIPISFAFYYSTRLYYEHFNYYWAVRPIGFGLTTIVFGIMTWLFLGEVPNTKTLICIVLSIVIILIQLSDVVKL